MKIKCNKCKQPLFVLPDDYTMDIPVICIPCSLGRKKPKAKRALTTRAGNYARVKKGVRPDVHPDYMFRSPTEANFARILKHLNIEYEFEKRAFTFNGYKTKPYVYIMDFEILKIDGRKVVPEGLQEGLYEIKGYMDVQSRKKLRRLKQNYPGEAAKTTVVLYTKYKKKDIELCKQLGYKIMFYDELTKMFKDIIKGWE